MSHNPEKSKVLCVIAQGSFWTLRILSWFIFVTFGAVAVVGMVIKAYQHWSWTEIGKSLLALLVVVGVIVLPVVVGKLIYEWAKDYREDC